jgi:hypothetical protein
MQYTNHFKPNYHFFLIVPLWFVLSHLEAFEELKKITIQLSDEEYIDYIERGKSIYNKRMKKKITDEEYVRWVFLLGEYYKGQCLSEST